jgi:hypothetical protein
MGKMRNAHKILVRKPRCKRPIAKSRHIWEVNMKMDISETGTRVWTGWNWLRVGSCGGFL